MASHFKWRFWKRSAVAFTAGLLFSVACRAQNPLEGSQPESRPTLFQSDLAVLEAGDSRKDLPCTVKPQKALLGFDLKFHGGYEVLLPLSELEGEGNSLTILFRIKANDDREPAHFTQHFGVPAVEQGAHGDALLQGSFDLGEGSYHVEWLMRDRSQRYCSANWDFEARLSSKDHQVRVALPQGAICRSEGEQFQEEPPAQRGVEEPPLNVKVLVNCAPQNSDSATLQPLDINVLGSILRSISRAERIGKFSLVAFNLQEQRVLYRQESADRIDSPALGEAIKNLRLGTVDVKQLGQKHGDTEFLTNLVKLEAGGDAHTDALIFAGPKMLLDSKVREEDLKQIGDLGYPVFYMNYTQFPQTNPWKDTISHITKFFKGYEFTISHPRDLWRTVSEIVSNSLKFKQTRTAFAASPAAQ